MLTQNRFRQSHRKVDSASSIRLRLELNELPIAYPSSFQSAIFEINSLDPVSIGMIVKRLAQRPVGDRAIQIKFS